MVGKSIQHQSILTGKPPCIFESLRGVINEYGNVIEIKKEMETKTQCELYCNSWENCHSFNFCRRENKCYFFDKILSGLDEVKESDDCITSYKKCNSGNHLRFLFQFGVVCLYQFVFEQICVIKIY